MKFSTTLMIACLAFTMALVRSASAQEAVKERRLQELLHPYYLEEAGRYKFTLDGTAATELELIRTPVMSWTGQESGLTSGDIFVWTRDGRAEVIGCIGSLPISDGSRRIFHEFHALTVAPLPALRVADQEWAPERPGVELEVIAEAPEPASRPEQRMVQMRSLAREFETRMTASAVNEARLRLLPQPIYRQESADNSRTDGALFAFVWTLGTDPEVLLLLESGATDEGYRWHYAPVRFTHRPVALEHRGKEVWTAGAHNSVRMPKEPYITRLTGVATIDQLEAAARRASGATSQSE
jgi:hypothetical protein